MAAVLKTAGRKPVGVRVPHPPHSLNAYQPNATARKVVQLLPGFSTVDANGQSRPFQTSVVGGSNPVASGESVVITTRSDYELGASGNLLHLHTVDNFGRDEREFHHEFGFVDNLGNRTLFVRDMLGSVRATLKNGTIVEWNDYYAYGAVRDSWSLANGRWKYLGAEADNETGTLHLDAREHDGLIGRLWQVDPMWQLYPHQSPYIYGNANPFRFRDRNGMSSDTLTVEAEEIEVEDDYIAPMQSLLDVFSVIPGWGVPINAMNAGTSFGTGDYLTGGIYLLGMMGSSSGNRQAANLAKKAARQVAKIAQRVHEIATNLTKKTQKYSNLKCMPLAKDIARDLKLEGIKGEFIDIESKGGPFIWSNKEQGSISENGKHRGVLVNGIVYDNIHREGVPEDMWIKDFDAPGGIKMNKTPF